jgi:chromosome segregation ATPase
MDHSELDKEIESLEADLRYGYIPSGETDFKKWDAIFRDIENIHEEFKSVRYPRKEQRDIAWKKFALLRDTAYKGRRKHFDQRSEIHKKDIVSRLNTAEYSELAEFAGAFISFGVIQTTDEEMKEKGRYLNEIVNDFLPYKQEISKEHQDEIWEKVKQVRESHNYYWNRRKEYYEERKSKSKENTTKNLELNREKLGRAENALEKQKNNLTKNENSLEKAKNALEKMKGSRDDLKDKISESYNDNWKEKAEGWLDELEDKISDVKDSIERLEKWIEEGEEKIKDIEGYVEKLRGWIDEDERKF